VCLVIIVSSFMVIVGGCTPEWRIESLPSDCPNLDLSIVRNLAHRSVRELQPRNPVLFGDPVLQHDNIRIQNSRVYEV
jgi:hypothetical protein